MNLEKGNISLGLNFAGNKLFAVEAKGGDDQLNLISVAESSSDISFDFDVIGNESYIQKFADQINTLLEQKNIKATETHLALERRMVFLKVINVEKELAEAQLKQQVEWELEQVLISPRDEYNVGYERLVSSQGSFESVLIVAVRKSIINYMKEIFDRTPLQLTVVDVDIFAAIRSIINVVGTSSEGFIALIDFNKRGIDFGLVRNGKFVISSEISSVSDDDGTNPIAATGEEIAKLVNDELIRLLQKINVKEIDDVFEQIYLCGEQADSEIIDQLKKYQQSARIDFANPFQNLNQTLNDESQSFVDEHPEKFVVSMGMLYSDG